MAYVSLNLGVVKALHVGVNPPTNLDLIWKNSDDGLHYVYDSDTTSWVLLKGATEFTGLTDAPNSYSGSAGQFVKVNATADGLEFSTVTSTTNLAYTQGAANGVVTSDTGTDATILAADATYAGLMIPAQFTKLAYITVTQAVDLDTMESDIALKISGSGTSGYLPKYTGSLTQAISNIYDSSTAIGIFTASPSFDISIGGNAARTLSLERHTTADTAGNNLTIQSGGAASGATNKSAGNVLIKSATATGTGSGNIQFWTTTAGASGTTDRTATLKATITSAGALDFEQGGFISVGGNKWLHYTNSGTPTFTTNGCTFLGYNSGLSNNGNGNTAVGQQAFRDIGNGTNNTAVGRFAGQETTSGVNNAFFGYYAGSGITTTSYNAFFGGYAGSQTTGSYNTACGYNAMPNNTSGGYNTGVGNDSLYSLTSATYSVGIGFGTLNGTAITGSYNVALGANAGGYVRTTSAQNTFLGYSTGFLTGEGPFSYSVAIGAGAIVRASNTAVIGGYTNAQKISTVYFGSSAVYTQGDVAQSTVTLMAGGTYYNAGANMGGNNLAICAGLATGSGAAGTGFGDLYLQTTSVTGSGSTLGTATTRITIKGGTGEIIPVLPTSSAGLTTGALWNDSGTVKVA